MFGSATRTRPDTMARAENDKSLYRAAMIGKVVTQCTAIIASAAKNDQTIKLSYVLSSCTYRILNPKLINSFLSSALNFLTAHIKRCLGRDDAT